MVGYIGKEPTVGNFIKLDSITTSATTTFNLLNGGVAYSPESARVCQVSLNGVIQNPETAFNIVGSTIVFSQALTSDDVIDYILVLGDVMSVGTPSDATVSTAKIVDSAVTTAKINDDAVTEAKLNLISTSSVPSLEAKGDGSSDGYIQLNCSQNSHGIKLKSPPHSANQNYSLVFPSTAPATDKFLKTDSSGNLSFADAGGGGILQVKSTTKTGTQLIASSSFTAISSLTVSVTPSSTSNKLLLFGSVSFGGEQNLYGQGALYRQIASGGYSILTNAIGDADSNATRCTIPMQTLSSGDPSWKTHTSSFNFLDAPNTTSQVDYQIYCRSQNGGSIYINEEENTSDGDYDARPITTITILEIDSGVL
tara:strand:+ start:9106 stop:10206 length:1101 start_codon:yes stop_codon:yes gene_type:complete